MDGEFNGLPVVIEHSYSGKGREFNSKLKKLEQEQQLVAWQLLLRTSDGYLVKLPPRDQVRTCYCTVFMHLTPMVVFVAGERKLFLESSSTRYIYL